MEEADSTGAILSRAARLLRLNAKMAAITILVLGAVGFLLRGSLVIGGAVGIIALYSNTHRVLSELDLVPSGYQSPPVFPMLALSILTFLGYCVGLVLLVIPGIVLLVRWSVSVPILIGEDAGVIDALRGSWRATEGRFWAILGAIAVPLVPMIAIIGGSVAIARSPQALILNGLVSVLVNGLMVIFWYIATAIYVRPFGALQRLEEVFA